VAAPGRVLYVASVRRGLSAGRNTGAKRALGEVVLFTDDDVIPDRYWVGTTAAEFAAGTDVAIVGGRIMPLEKSAAGAAPSAARRTGAELTRGGLERREYDKPVLPWWLASGGNMAVRRTVFEACGGFDEVLGAGAPLRSCEDLDICYRTLAHRHGKVVFTPASLVYHDNPKAWAEVVRTERSYGVGAGAVFLKFWRCGHRPAARLFATWIWHMAVRRAGAGLLKWRNLQVVRLALQQFYAPFEGLLAGSRYPVDRERWLFRPAGARPDAP
jgi:GT2 family glycosyltransferase